MQIQIGVVVSKYPGKDKVIAHVRKAILNDTGDKLIRRSALLSNGKWKDMTDSRWPLNSTLEVSIHDIGEETNCKSQ